MPPKSQAHCLVARADTRPKPAKELALPTHGLIGIKHETPTNGQTACGVMNKLGTFELLINFGNG